jgi:hypothetical protein
MCDPMSARPKSEETKEIRRAPNYQLSCRDSFVAHRAIQGLASFERCHYVAYSGVPRVRIFDTTRVVTLWAGSLLGMLRGCIWPSDYDGINCLTMVRPFGDTAQ